MTFSWQHLSFNYNCSMTVVHFLKNSKIKHFFSKYIPHNISFDLELINMVLAGLSVVRLRNEREKVYSFICDERVHRNFLERHKQVKIPTVMHYYVHCGIDFFRASVIIPHWFMMGSSFFMSCHIHATISTVLIAYQHIILQYLKMVRIML